MDARYIGGICNPYISYWEGTDLKLKDMTRLKRKNFLLLMMSFIIFFLGMSVFGIIKIMTAKGNSAAISAMSIQTEDVNRRLESVLKPAADSIDVVKKWNGNSLIDINSVRTPSAFIIPLLSGYEQINGFLLSDSDGNLCYIVKKGDLWTEYCAHENKIPEARVAIVSDYDENGTVVKKSAMKLAQSFFDEISREYTPDRFLTEDDQKMSWKVVHSNRLNGIDSLVFSKEWANGSRVMRASVSFSLNDAVSEFSNMSFSEHFLVFMVTRHREGITIFSGEKVPNRIDPESISKVLKDWNDRGGTLASPVRMADLGILYYIQPFSGDKDMYIGILLFEQLMKDGEESRLPAFSVISLCVAGVGLIMFFSCLIVHRKEESDADAGDVPSTEKGWLELIAKGESDRLEFKSSMRWDMNNDCKNVKLEDVIVKTVGAFANSEGGILIIGVRDDGEPLGLEKDYSTLKKPDKDGFELHLREILGTAYSIEAAAKNVKIEFPTVSGREICAVIVSPASGPLFMKTVDPKRGKVEKFYIRSGNSSRELENLSEISKYESSHFRKKKK